MAYRVMVVIESLVMIVILVRLMFVYCEVSIGSIISGIVCGIFIGVCIYTLVVSLKGIIREGR